MLVELRDEGQVTISFKIITLLTLMYILHGNLNFCLFGLTKKISKCVWACLWISSIRLVMFILMSMLVYNHAKGCSYVPIFRYLSVPNIYFCSWFCSRCTIIDQLNRNCSWNKVDTRWRIAFLVQKSYKSQLDYRSIYVILKSKAKINNINHLPLVPPP